MIRKKKNLIIVVILFLTMLFITNYNNTYSKIIYSEKEKSEPLNYFKKLYSDKDPNLKSYEKNNFNEKYNKNVEIVVNRDEFTKLSKLFMGYFGGEMILGDDFQLFGEKRCEPIFLIKKRYVNDKDYDLILYLNCMDLHKEGETSTVELRLITNAEKVGYEYIYLYDVYTEGLYCSIISQIDYNRSFSKGSSQYSAIGCGSGSMYLGNKKRKINSDSYDINNK